MKEQRSSRAGPRLGELLGRHDTQREPAVDELGRQSFGRGLAAFEHDAETHLLRVADPIVELRKRVAVVQIGGVNHVSRSPQPVGERVEPLGLPLCVMEQQDLGHRATLLSRRISRGPRRDDGGRPAAGLRPERSALRRLSLRS